MTAPAWIHPTPTTADDARPLTDEQVAQWRTGGASVVQDLLPPALIAAAGNDARDHYGTIDRDGPGDFGSDGQLVFPADRGHVNEITLHPRLLAAVAQLLGCPVRELRLTQSDLWAKWGRSQPVDDPYDNNDQRIHVDYPNHMLTHPPTWDAPEAVEMIIYMDRVEGCGGATGVVVRTGDDDPAYPYPIIDTPGVGPYPWVNDRGRAEELMLSVDQSAADWRAAHLYAREQQVHYSPGTVLLYRLDTWHRGTPIVPGALRVVQNITFRRAESEWISTVHQGWSWAAYRRSQSFERLIARCSVDQRTVLGFPAPGHRSWTTATIDAVGQRYAPHGIDLSEYRAAIDN